MRFLLWLGSDQVGPGPKKNNKRPDPVVYPPTVFTWTPKENAGRMAIEAARTVRYIVERTDKVIVKALFRHSAGIALSAAHDAQQLVSKMLQETGLTDQDVIHPAIRTLLRLKNEGNEHLRADKMELAKSKYTEAIEGYLQAAQKLRDFDDGTTLGMCYSNRALVHLQQSDPEAALEEEDYRHAPTRVRQAPGDGVPRGCRPC